MFWQTTRKLNLEFCVSLLFRFRCCFKFLTAKKSFDCLLIVVVIDLRIILASMAALPPIPNDIKAIAKSLVTNQKYKGEVARFLHWVRENNRTVIVNRIDSNGNNQPVTIFVTRDNVDDYFEQIVELQRTNINSDSAGAIHRGIQVYADQVDYRGQDPGFVVVPENNRRSRIAQSIHRRNLAHMAYMQEHPTDAHSNVPTDALTFAKHLEVMRFLFGQKPYESKWDEFSLSWCVNFSTYLRMASLRNTRFCDLMANDSHGPVRSGPNATILCIIMQPFCHKDQTVVNPANQRNANGTPMIRSKDPIGNSHKRVVGMFRSRNFLQCGTGHVARSLCMRLFTDTEFSFLQPTLPRSRPTWQRYMLLKEWSGENNRNAINDVYRRVLQRSGARFNHLTHMRSAGMEFASAEGLDASIIATMSKHILDKIHGHYMTELCRVVLIVMAGFEKDDKYFVPRTEVQIPFEHNNEYVTHVFPNYRIWIEELQSGNGDRHKKAAENFLYKLLPYLARVVIQDAPYWLRYYPTHHWSEFLRTNFLCRPEYKDFCDQAINKASDIATSRQVNGIENLNEAAR